MEDRNSLYAYVGVLVGFKIWTLILILWLMSSWHAVVFIVVGHVLWIVAIAVIVAGPATFWMRLLRARARRRKLQHAEWHVDDPLESVQAEHGSDD